MCWAGENVATRVRALGGSGFHQEIPPRNHQEDPFEDSDSGDDDEDREEGRVRGTMMSLQDLAEVRERRQSQSSRTGDGPREDGRRWDEVLAKDKTSEQDAAGRGGPLRAEAPPSDAECAPDIGPRTPAKNSWESSPPKTAEKVGAAFSAAFGRAAEVMWPGEGVLLDDVDGDTSQMTFGFSADDLPCSLGFSAGTSNESSDSQLALPIMEARRRQRDAAKELRSALQGKPHYDSRAPDTRVVSFNLPEEVLLCPVFKAPTEVVCRKQNAEGVFDLADSVDEYGNNSSLEDIRLDDDAPPPKIIPGAAGEQGGFSLQDAPVAAKSILANPEENLDRKIGSGKNRDNASEACRSTLLSVFKERRPSKDRSPRSPPRVRFNPAANLVDGLNPAANLMDDRSSDDEEEDNDETPPNETEVDAGGNTIDLDADRTGTTRTGGFFLTSEFCHHGGCLYRNSGLLYCGGSSSSTPPL